MNSRNSNIRFYILSFQAILLFISNPFGLCVGAWKPHGLGLDKHLQLKLTDVNNAAVPLPFSSTPPQSPSPSQQTPPHYAPAVTPPPTIHPLPPPPSNKKPEFAVWCVAKPTVPEVLLQQAMDYACGSGAGCEAIQLNGVCFQPDTILSHASYAFNSYWQKTKQAGGTCEFGGTAMLVTADPSYNECRFLCN